MSEEQKYSEQGEVSLFGNTKFGKWLDNFWYHYKVQTLIVIGLLVVVAICIGQCAARPGHPDAYLCYAGAKDIRPTSQNTTALDMETSLEGQINGALGMEGASATVFHYLIVHGSENATTQNLSLTNIETLKAQLDVAGSYIYLLDPILYNTYTVTAGGAHYMTEVAPYLKDGSTVELTPDGRGVYLGSTPLYALPGFSNLPYDTVLCLRIEFTISGSMTAKEREKFYDKQEQIFSYMLNGQ